MSQAYADQLLPEVMSYLQNDINVSGLVGQRVYEDIPDEGAPWPFVIVQQIDSTQDHLLDGTPIGLPKTRVQFDIRAANPKQRRTVSIAIIELLDGFRGWMNSVYIAAAMKENEVNEYEPVRRESRKILDFMFIQM